MKLSIVIPVYNGEKTITKLSKEIVSALGKSSDYEIIFVYDCGPDNSWEVIQELVAKYKGLVKGVKLSRNFGQHNAILAGITLAKGDFIVTMDEDLQHDPKDIRLLLDKQSATDADVIYGKYEELNHSFFRNITSSMMRKMLQIGLPELNQNYSAFRLIRKDIAQKSTQMNNSYTFLDGYLSWITTSIDFVSVKHQERLEGESSYTTKKLIEHSINIFITFSNFPIRLLSRISMLVFFFTFFYSLYVVFRKIIYNDLAMGFSSVIILLGFGISVIMFGIRILGEYLHRINLKITNRPNYNIKEIIK